MPARRLPLPTAPMQSTLQPRHNTRHSTHTQPTLLLLLLLLRVRIVVVWRTGDRHRRRRLMCPRRSTTRTTVGCRVWSTVSKARGAGASAAGDSG